MKRLRNTNYVPSFHFVICLLTYFRSSYYTCSEEFNIEDTQYNKLRNHVFRETSGTESTVLRKLILWIFVFYHLLCLVFSGSIRGQSTVWKMLVSKLTYYVSSNVSSISFRY